MMMSPDANTANIFQGQLQLLRGWMNFDRDVYEFEIYGAAARVGVNIDILHYLIPDHDPNSKERDVRIIKSGAARFQPLVKYTSAQKWDMFLSFAGVLKDQENEEITVKQEQPKPGSLGRRESIRKSRRVTLKSSLHTNTQSKRRRVTISEVLEPCIKFATEPDERSRSQSFYASWGVAISVGLVPIFIDNPLYENPHTFYYYVVGVIFLLSSSLLTVVYGFVMFQFLFTATIDTQRRLRIATLLSGLVRPVHQDFSPHISLFGFDGASIKGIIWKHVKQGMDHVSSMGTSRHNVHRDSALPDLEMIQHANDKDHAGERRDDPDVIRIGHNSRQFEIIDCPEKMAKEFDEWHVPKVDFEIPQNIYAWMYTRLVVQNYGNRMLFRISLYSGRSSCRNRCCMGFNSCALLGGIFLQVIIAGLAIIFAVLHSNMPYQLVETPVVIQCIMLAMASITVLIKYILLGSMLNDEFSTHRNLLVLNAMRCESELAELLTMETDSSLDITNSVSVRRGASSKFVMAPAPEPQIFTASPPQTKGKSLKFADLNSSALEVQDVDGEKSMSTYHRLIADRMDARFAISGKDVSVSATGQTPKSSGKEAPLQQRDGPSPIQSTSDSSSHVHGMSLEAVPHNPEHSMKTRLKIFELEESVKAMRRAVEAIDISNKEYTARVSSHASLLSENLLVDSPMTM
jgi:hypothetical protein